MEGFHDRVKRWSLSLIYVGLLAGTLLSWTQTLQTKDYRDGAQAFDYGRLDSTCGSCVWMLQVQKTVPISL